MNSQLITVWKLIPHHEDKDNAIAWTKANRRIAVGWGFVGDIRSENYIDAKDIGKVIKRAFEEGTHPSKNYGEGGGTLWSFANEMKIDDYVILPNNKGRQLVVKITGDYQYSSDPHLARYNHQRDIELTEIHPDTLWQLAGGKVISGCNPRATLTRCANQVNIDDL